MKRITLNKIASVTRNLHLRQQVVLGTEIPAEIGTVVACRVRSTKTAYNKLEDVYGRQVEVRSGDLIAGALGERHALHGFSGKVPETAKVGDTLQLLNMGGVIGAGAEPVPGLGSPHELEVLGTVLSFPGLDRSAGRPANIADHSFDVLPLPKDLPPIILLLGTAMDAGKTTAAASIISGLVRDGERVAAGKLTGVSLRRDILLMGDCGANPVTLFTDFGVVTSAPENAPATARAIVAHLAESDPSLIVLEMGDGLLGTYGVQAILQDPEIRANRLVIVLCASDPVGAWGAQQLMKEQYGLSADLISGPVTDTPVGRGFCNEELGLPAHNALLDADGLAKACAQALAQEVCS
ncbi:MAG: hypothetical protein GY930_19665 [bacterium]|nr:hypothetical protein [bacterium]